jgi:copper chaperone CopZ
MQTTRKAMKALFATSVVIAAFVATMACNAGASGTSVTTTSSAQARTTEAESKADVRQVMIPVEGMSCGACAARLKRGLKAVDGVVDADVSLEHASARIRYMSTKTNPDKLVAVIRELGFTPGTPSAIGS